MANEQLPPELIRFIKSHMESLSHLEVLLLLHGSGRAFTPEEINDSQRCDLAFIENILALLVKQGLASLVEGPIGVAFLYQPASAELAARVDQLAKLYPRYRVRIIATIYAATDPMQSFADAFRLKKEPHSNG